MTVLQRLTGAALAWANRVYLRDVRRTSYRHSAPWGV